MNLQLIQEQADKAHKLMISADPDGAFTYHNWVHVSYVKEAADRLLEDSGFDSEHVEDVLIAAVWHDADIANGYQGHEERSADLAKASLRSTGLSATRIDRVARIILATDLKATATQEDEKIIKDADLAHLASSKYFEFYDALYHELEVSHGKVMSREAWMNECIGFMENSRFHSSKGKEIYEMGKNANLTKLRAMAEENLPDDSSGQGKKKKKKSKKLDKNYRPDKGIETMFRVALRNHISLSRIADDKANTLISVNAIILSIVLSALFPKLDSNPFLIYPGLSLILVSITTIILATLSTIPKTTHGAISKDDVLNKRGNLIFFGNFHSMSLEEYEWSLDELMGDGEYIYKTLTRDLYFLGKVLDRKYSLLRNAYVIFVVGLVLSIILFASSILKLGIL